MIKSQKKLSNFASKIQLLNLLILMFFLNVRVDYAINPIAENLSPGTCSKLTIKTIEQDVKYVQS